jgi:hypothetical protein
VNEISRRLSVPALLTRSPRESELSVTVLPVRETLAFANADDGSAAITRASARPSPRYGDRGKSTHPT